MTSMLASRILASWSQFIKQKAYPTQGWLILQICFLVVIPYVFLAILPMDNKGLYVGILSFLNLIMMVSMMLQFPLAARLKRAKLFSRIDWNMQQHKRMGKWIGAFFFLHPALILLPKWFLSGADLSLSIIESITAPRLLTGIIAWVLLAAWVLFSIYKNKFPLSYAKWKLLHTAGFMAILILATWHITQVGSHGQFGPHINQAWWLACGLSLAFTVYGYTLKPRHLSKHAFTLVSREKANFNDWLITIRAQSDFTFQAGQFVWLSTQKDAYRLDYHPFSIASTPRSLPELSFVVRELGDYTRSLDQLQPGQAVFVDGPYGNMTLATNDTSNAIILIASGIGIAPIIGLLRTLAESNEPRPVRLIYSNRTFSQMLFCDELAHFEQNMEDFKTRFVCYLPSTSPIYYQGFIDKTCLQNALQDVPVETSSVYLCGSAVAVKNIRYALKDFPIAARNIYFEQLSF
ncbi:ferredoxin reductase family protein [Marinomonas pollencensis]|nr:ferredoxin reductase family protein [Marinomonas pollencensis]